MFVPKYMNWLRQKIHEFMYLRKYFFFVQPRKLIFTNSNEITVHVILTQLRCMTSCLNYGLYKSNINLNHTRRCGAICEDSKHFLLDCAPYKADRIILMNNTNQSIAVEEINIDLLIRNKSDLSSEDKDITFKQVLF